MAQPTRIVPVVVAMVTWTLGGAEVEPPDLACARAKVAAFERARAAGVDVKGEPSVDETAADSDVLHYRLDVEIDPSAQTLKGSNTMTVRAVKDGMDRMVVRLWKGFAAEIRVDGRAVTVHRRDERTLEVPLGRAFASGVEFEVMIDFAGAPRSDGMGSITFTTHSGSPIVTTLSEPWYSYTWWPVKEDNRDKATADLLFTAPSSMTVVSNGALVEVDDVSGGRRRFHWRTSYPTAPYLFFFSATNYASFEATHVFDGGSMPVQFFLYPENDLPGNRAAWLQSLEMLDVFASLFGPYPFRDEKFGIYQFPFQGGMEHQTISGHGLFSPWLTTHELAHQWWGNMITCATWHDIWLNEGFATYSEILWSEFRGGASDPSARKVAINAKRPILIDGSVYCYNTTLLERLFSFQFTYRKAGWVVHMLRGVLGDEAFFDLLQLYRQRFEYQSVTTGDLQAVAEEIYGGGMDWFFQPWVYGIGEPAYRYAWRSVVADGREWVEFALEQVQSARYATFTMPVELELTLPAGETRATVWNTSRKQYFLLPAPGRASDVVVDPDDWILSTSKDAVAFTEGPPKIVTVSPAPGSRAAITETGELRVTFHKPVVAQAADFSLAGDREGAVPCTFALVDGGVTAAIRPLGVLTPGTYALTVSDGVVDRASGQRLDGEMRDGRTLPSGDGLPGGSAVASFTVVRDIRPRVPVSPGGASLAGRQPGL